MIDEQELRLLKMVLHAASQQAYHWLHPDSVQKACTMLQGLQLRGRAMHELSLPRLARAGADGGGTVQRRAASLTAA